MAFRFVETVTQLNPQATRLGAAAAQLVAIVGNSTFRAWALLLVAAAYGGLFFMLAGIVVRVHRSAGLSRLACGAMLASCSVAYVAGTILCRHLLLRHGLRCAVAPAAR